MQKKRSYWLPILLAIPIVVAAVFIAVKDPPPPPSKKAETAAGDSLNPNTKAGFLSLENALDYWEAQDPTIALRMAQDANQRNPSPALQDRIQKLFRNHPHYQDLTAGQYPIEFGALSPDGKRLAFSMEGDPFIYVTDGDGKLRFRLNDGAGHARALHFTPGGDSLYAGSPNSIRMWDLKAGYHYPYGFSNEILSMALSPDGKQLLTGEGNNMAILRDLEGKPIAKLKGHRKQSLPPTDPVSPEQFSRQKTNAKAALASRSKGVTAVAFSPNGAAILTGGVDSSLIFWDPQGVQLTRVRGHQGAILDLAWFPDGAKILSGAAEATARIWDASGKLLHELKGHEKSVSAVAVHPSGQKLVTGDEAGKVRVWDTNGKLLQTRQIAYQGITKLEYSADGNSIFALSATGTAHSLDTNAFESTHIAAGRARWTSMDWHPDGSSLYVGAEDGRFRQISQNGKLQDGTRVPGHGIQSLYYDQRHQELLLGLLRHKPVRYLFEPIREIGENPRYFIDFRSAPLHYQHFLLHPNGVAVLWASQETLTTSVGSMNEDQVIPGLSAVAASPDGKHILAASKNGDLILLNPLLDILRSYPSFKANILALAWSPSNNQFALLTETGKIWVLDSSGTQLGAFESPAKALPGSLSQAPVRPDLAFTTDGQSLLLSAPNRGALYQYAFDGSLQKSWQGHTAIAGFSFHPEDGTLYTYGQDGSIRKWYEAAAGDSLTGTSPIQPFSSMDLSLLRQEIPAGSGK